MADAMVLEQSQTTDTRATDGVADQGSADKSKVQVPGYVKGQLGSVGEALLKEIEGDPSLATRLPKGIPELYQSWRTLEKENSSAIRVPAKDAPKEAWDRYYKAIGRPDGPDKYALKIPQLPNGLTYNDKLEKWFRQQLFDAGISQTTAEKMFNDWNASQIAAYDANQKAQEQQRIAFAKQTQETLQAEWKDDYGRNVETMKAAIARFGGPEVLQVLQNARLPNGVTLDNHPAFAKAFYEIGKRMEADTMVAGETGAGATRTDEGRPGLPLDPVTGRPMPMMYPNMEKDPRFRVKAE